MSEPFQQDRPIALPLHHRIWLSLCLALMALGVLFRAAFFAWDEPPALLDALLSEALVRDLYTSFALAVAGVLLSISSAPVVLGLLLLRPRRLLVRDGRVWATAPWLFSLVVTLLTCESWALDLNPDLGWVGLASLVGLLVLPGFDRGALATLPGRATAAAWALLLAGGLLLVHDLVERLAVLVWGAALLGVAALADRIARRDRAWIAAGLFCAIQLGASSLPVVLPVHGGTHLADGMVYSYCEDPERGRIFAVVPECPADLTKKQLPRCMDGYVEEIDTASLDVVAVHRFFDETFYGRMEQIACLGDQVQIGMEHTRIGDEVRLEHVMRFDPGDPTRFERDPVGPLGGARIFPDPVNGDLYYLSAYANHISVLRNGASEPVARRPVQIPGGSTDGAVYEAGRTLLILGRDRDPVHAVSLPGLERTRQFAQTMGLELSVDEKRGRLLVSGLFGLEVFDLETGELIARRRTGFISRQAVFDHQHDIVYIPTFGEGKLRVYDADSLELLGKIPVGVYIRYPHLSPVAGRLFAGSWTDHYHWSTRALAERFLGDRADVAAGSAPVGRVERVTGDRAGLDTQGEDGSAGP